MTTQLRHVDIHQHWLRQEVQNKRISVNWVGTNDMIADGITKALPKVKHIDFVKQLNIEDIRERISLESLLEDAKERVKYQLKDQHQSERTERLGYKGGQKKGSTE